jgi:hypothetical protein
MVKYTLLITDKNSDINKKILAFVKKNLYDFNKANIVFEFEIVGTENYDEYLKKGIKSFPVLVNNKENILGLTNIAKFLQEQVMSYNKKIAKKSDEEHIDDFWKKTMGNTKPDKFGKIDTNDDDNINENDDLQKKLQNAFRERGNGPDASVKAKSKAITPTKTISKQGRQKKDESPVATLNKMKSKNADDILMAKYFENQEESL